MLNKTKIFASLVGGGFLISVTSPKTIAQLPLEMPIFQAQNVQFQPINQPLELKIAVTLGGIGLIGLELWWFLFSKSKAVQADQNQDIQ